MDGHVREVVIHHLEAEGAEVEFSHHDEMAVVHRGGFRLVVRLPDLLSDEMWAMIRRRLDLPPTESEKPN